MKQPHELIYDRIHDIQQRLEQRFERRNRAFLQAPIRCGATGGH